MLNFAYGSNMLLAKIQRDAPSAVCKGVATLRDYKLCWHKPSTLDYSGKCDISKSDGDLVFGVLYEIADEEMPALDKAEGGYERRQIEVEHRGRVEKVWAYFAKRQDSTLLPHSWYKALVLAGAKRAKLPEAYVNQLESIQATLDKDQERHDRNMSIANAG